MIGHSLPRPAIRLIRRIIVIGALLLTAPAIAQPTGGINPEVWATQPDGTVTHKPTGATFPAAYGIFKRSRVVTIAPDGSDIAISYDAEDGATRTRLSVFLFRPHDGERGQI